MTEAVADSPLDLKSDFGMQITVKRGLGGFLMMQDTSTKTGDPKTE